MHRRNKERVLVPPKLLLRNQRLRRDESSTKPTLTRLWTVINSAFFLWVLTTVVVGAFSAVWSKRLECRATFADSEQRFIQSLSEYQYRQANYFAALRKARTPEERDEAEKWKGAASTSSQAIYQSRTMADISLDMLRSFGDLALVSNIDSFDVVGTGLSIARSDGTTSTMAEPSVDTLKKIQGSLASSAVLPKLTSSVTDGSSPTTLSSSFSRLRDNMYGSDSVLGSVRTAAMIKPTAKCGPSDVLTQMFSDTNQAYEKQVARMYAALQREYQTQMVALLAIEQLKSQPRSFTTNPLPPK